MQYSHCRDYLALYAENPAKISLLVLQDDSGQTMARSLIWQTDGGTYQDRIYANDDRDSERMRQYAADNLSASRSVPGDVSDINPPSTGEWPYCDTFYYANVDSDGSGHLTMSTEPNRYGPYYELTNTNGEAGGTAESRDYVVYMTRTITETVAVYVTAANDDDAREQAESEVDYVSDYDITRDADCWEVDYVTMN
jgi:hypothetical protein